MTSTDTPDNTGSRPRGGSAEKHNAILRAARKVFGRDGYARASIDVIAAEAGASTRTLYNHFGGKEALFTETVIGSASEVAAAQIAMVGRHLDEVTDLEAALVALGYDWVTSTVREQFADHFAMVRQITSEAAHFPAASLEAWREAGPRKVHRELAMRFERFQAQGRLRVANAERSAHHYLVLINSEVQERTFGGVVPLDDADLREIVADGVRAFLIGYQLDQ
ncbi:TetR/AcrR family transcriptional regulator [Rhodococcus sp. NPDC127528]|uniref:TetR/AcrR family transcriptional regulator n=1 Tax=unclassified Rhodococcus (in: high G+C Gram-positive bacteria) TaxID=192944 RepID=UPI00363749DB